MLNVAAPHRRIDVEIDLGWLGVLHGFRCRALVLFYATAGPTSASVCTLVNAAQKWKRRPFGPPLL
jgi:hypothetical protein